MRFILAVVLVPIFALLVGCAAEPVYPAPRLVGKPYQEEIKSPVPRDMLLPECPVR
ncbi:MAG: hypothetical protein HY323_11915 [Betaproteobacteria bacterium]|nr:hypothetical protein [Betaproteobacteria bacterium]MBI3937674.1 hypothetical protein [Betaproteobacteria bacterium]